MKVKLGENSFKFQTGSPGKFPGKRKSPSNYRRDQRRQTPPGKGIFTSGNHGVGSVTSGDPKRAKKGIISWVPSSPPCSRLVPWSRNLFFSLSNIPQLNKAGSFISEKGLDIRASTPFAVLLVQHECSRFTPLASIQQLLPTHPPTPWTTCE